MKQIDKNKEPYKSEAEIVIRDYLDSCCRNANSRYEGIRYDSKRDPGVSPCFCNANGGRYRRNFTKILVDSQDGYCCYCMRKLKTNQNEEDSDELITREHIIPRGFSAADTLSTTISYYQQCPELSIDNVLLTDLFENPAHDQSHDLPPYPHKVAYNNLVASCNGTFPYVRNRNQGKPKICCNEARKEDDAYPIYFINGIESMVVYMPSGDIQACNTVDAINRQRIVDVISNAHLDCEILKDIRHLWYLLSYLPKDKIYSCNTADKRNSLFCEHLYKDQFFEYEKTPYIHANFIKDDFWNTFMLYDYFYDVYRAQHP